MEHREIAKFENLSVISQSVSRPAGLPPRDEMPGDIVPAESEVVLQVGIGPQPQQFAFNARTRKPALRVPVFPAGEIPENAVAPVIAEILLGRPKAIAIPRQDSPAFPDDLGRMRVLSRHNQPDEPLHGRATTGVKRPPVRELPGSHVHRELENVAPDAMVRHHPFPHRQGVGKRPLDQRMVHHVAFQGVVHFPPPQMRVPDGFPSRHLQRMGHVGRHGLGKARKRHIPGQVLEDGLCLPPQFLGTPSPPLPVFYTLQESQKWKEG